jgi:hypothetical protein
MQQGGPQWALLNDLVYFIPWTWKSWTVSSTLLGRTSKRESFRDRQKDGELQQVLGKLVFDSAGSDKINFDTLCDRVLASMPDTWMVFTSGGPHRSPKVST